jgi:hypothetical protein
MNSDGFPCAVCKLDVSVDDGVWAAKPRPPGVLTHQMVWACRECAGTLW